MLRAAAAPRAGSSRELRGGPVRPGRRGRHPDPERAPDLGARGDGPGAVAGARHRLRLQLGELRLGFTQLAALYVLAEGSTTTIADLAEAIGRSPSATSRLVDGLVRRRLVERRREEDDGRQRSVWLTPAGPRHPPDGRPGARGAVPGRGAADADRGERALIAMGVAALATHAISRRGRLVRGDT